MKAIAISVATDPCGNRIGYFADGIFIPIGQPFATTWSAWLASRKPEPAPTAKVYEVTSAGKPLIHFDGLPRFNGWCHNSDCNLRLTDSSAGRYEAETDQGERLLYVCPHCGQMHRY